MDALEYRIKGALNHIIKNTFPDKKIKPLKIEFLKKDTKSFHGDYNLKEMKARIGNLSRPPAHVLITSLHEAAHHCEAQMTGTTGHQKSFYVIYHKLMVTAVEMGMFSYDEAKTVTDSASIKQLERYCGPITQKAIPEKKYKKDRCLIYVFDGYSQRQALASHGYHFNSRAKAWERELAKSEREEEEAYLNSLSDSLSIWSTEDMLDLTIFATITVSGNTYPCKDILSSLNFKFWKKIPGTDNPGWTKKVRSVQLPEYKNAIRILSDIPGVKVDIEY